MPNKQDNAEAYTLKRECAGVVIPVYLPPDTDPDKGARMVRGTVAAFVREVADPRCVCVALDGQASGLDLVRGLERGFGVTTCVVPENRGKLASCRLGMQTLLENRDLEYLAVVDQDGDHFSNELLNFVRSAEHVRAHTDKEGVMVLGRRMSRHRPMGFLRGELEELADRMLLDTLHYRAAVSDAPLRLQFALTIDEFPDFHSGYKLLSRHTAEKVFASPPRLCGVSDEAYYRHAVEAVMTVEAMDSGAWLAVIHRSTLDEQPVTTFGRLNRQQLVADKIIWPCKRLGVPAHFVDQWLRNHMPRLQLGTLLPEGRDEMLGIRRLVMEAFDRRVDDGPDIMARPEFI